MSEPLATDRTTAISSSLLPVDASLGKNTGRRGQPKKSSTGTCPYQRESRGHHQRRVDRVDIPRPTEWLHHDAIAALQLGKDAQVNLQLLTQPKRWQQPHSSSSGAGGRPAMGPPPRHIIPQVKGVVASTMAGGAIGVDFVMTRLTRERRALRVLCGGDLLPWGTWPVRLRNHEGESFYGEGDLDDGEAAGALHWTGGGGVGGSANLVDAVGAVSEHSIHDGLLRRQRQWRRAPPPRRFSSSSILPFSNPPRDAARDGGGGGCNSSGEAGDTELKRRHLDEGTVKRLLPDKRGRWVEAKAPTPSDPTAATLFIDDEYDGSPSGTARPFLTAPPAHPQPGPNDAGAVVKLVPGWYGGWVEIKETAEEAADKKCKKRKKRVAIAAAAARAGPNFSDPVAKTERPEDRNRPRRLRAAKRECSADTDGGDGQVGNGGETAEGRSSADVVDGKHGVGGGGGGTSGATVAVERSDGPVCDAQEGINGCGYGQGWTVSEPAKDTVRRVWNRARRRARDTYEPRHRSPAPPAAAPFAAAAAAATAATNPEAARRRKRKRRKGRGIAQQLSDRGSDIGGEIEGSDGDDDEPSRGDEEQVDGQGKASATDGGIRDSLDPVLLSCLGRECEGIIDAALHVVLRQQLLRRSSESTDPPVATDWEDVLRTMWGCSAAARAPARADRDDPSERDGGGGQGGQEGSGRGAGERGRRSTGIDIDSQPTVGAGDAAAPAAGQGEGQEEKGWAREVWGVGDASDGATVVVNERLPGLPLNEAVVTRAYNRLLLDLNEKKWWHNFT